MIPVFNYLNQKSVVESNDRQLFVRIPLLSLCLFLLVCITSCKKYLEKKPDQSFVEPKTISDMQAMLDHGNLMNDRSPALGVLSADDHYVPMLYYNNLSPISKDAYKWQLIDYTEYSNDWSFIYDVVNISNIVLENIDQVQMNASNKLAWQNVKGSALFYRAFSFLKAVWLFSKPFDESSSDQDLGISLRVASDFNQESVRSSVKESYERILTDLKEALTLLPSNSQNRLRPSLPAAQALLARVYLSMRNYDSAYKYANLCLQARSQLIDYKTLPNLNSSSFSFPTFDKNVEILFESRITTLPLYSASIAAAYYRVDSALYNSYAVGDLRKKAFFYFSSPGYRFKGSYTRSNELFVGLATDEVLLIRAECHARGNNGVAGDKDAALADLNTLLIKRWDSTFIPVTAATTQEALDIILNERRKEVVFRDLRWSDIKRLNKENANIILRRVIEGQTYDLQPNNNKYALQLPKPIIELTNMPQNPL